MSSEAQVGIEDARVGAWLTELNQDVDPVTRVEVGWKMGDWNQMEIDENTIGLHWLKHVEWSVFDSPHFVCYLSHPCVSRIFLSHSKGSRWSSSKFWKRGNGPVKFIDGTYTFRPPRNAECVDFVHFSDMG